MRLHVQFASLASALALVAASCGGGNHHSKTVPPPGSPQVQASTNDSPEADVTIRASDTPEPDYAAEHALAVTLLQSATSVSTFRTHGVMNYADSKRREDPRFKKDFVDVWPIDKRGPKMDRGFALRVGDFLLDDSNFLQPRGPQGVKACIFNPGVIFRLEAGSDHTEIVICFECNQMSVRSTQGHLRKPSGDFDPGRAKLAALAREAFPKDKDLQSLP